MKKGAEKPPFSLVSLSVHARPVCTPRACSKPVREKHKPGWCWALPPLIQVNNAAKRQPFF